MRLLLLEDHRLVLVSLSLLLKTHVVVVGAIVKVAGSVDRPLKVGHMVLVVLLLLVVLCVVVVLLLVVQVRSAVGVVVVVIEVVVLLLLLTVLVEIG